MKSITKILSLLLVAVTAFAFAACQNEQTDNENNVIDYAYIAETKTETQKDGEESKEVTVLTIKGLYITDAYSKAVSDNVYTPIDLVLGDETNKSVKTIENAEDVSFENGALKTVTVSDYDRMEIADDAFANQAVLGSVTLGNLVTSVGEAAFAGCANIKSVTVPFVGTSAEGALNQAKVFACIFGTSEVSGCTSTTVNYNNSGSQAYYIPNALEEITVNYAAEVTELPRYAFNGLSAVKKITVNGNGIKEIGAYAFADCTAMNTAVIPASVEIIGQSAFKSCSALRVFDFEKLTSLALIRQEAFSGCSKLGDKNAVVFAAGVQMYEKAFMSCTSIKSLDLSMVDVIPQECFYGCTALETLTLKETATVMNNAFSKCEKLEKANVTNYDESAHKNGFDF